MISIWIWCVSICGEQECFSIYELSWWENVNSTSSATSFSHGEGNLIRVSWCWISHATDAISGSVCLSFFNCFSKTIFSRRVGVGAVIQLPIHRFHHRPGRSMDFCNVALLQCQSLTPTSNRRGFPQGSFKDPPKDHRANQDHRRISGPFFSCCTIELAERELAVCYSL